MISTLANERLRKFEKAVDGWNGLPEVLFVRGRTSLDTDTLLVCSGGPLDEKLLLEMREVIDRLIKFRKG